MLDPTDPRATNEQRRRWDEANAQRCVLRRPEFFPIRLDDVKAEHEMDVWRYNLDGTPELHWTVLCEVVHYHNLMRPIALCMDSEGRKFNVAAYCSRNADFHRDVGSQLKPGRVLAIRYGEKKIFLDSTLGFRIEDEQVPMLKIIPGPLSKLLAAADVVFSEAAETELCWGCVTGTENLLRCARCKFARYCNKECQRGDWNMHKDICKYVVHVNELVGRGRAPFDLKNFEDYVPFPSDASSAATS